MPYIKQEERPPIDRFLDQLIAEIQTMLIVEKISDKVLAARLTYIVFKLLKTFYSKGKWYEKADAEKICNRAWHEFERRYLDPYEDQKLRENGDV